MIYTRRINDKSAVLDYVGKGRDLRLDILLVIKTIIDNKDIESYDLAVIILLIFKGLEVVDKVALVDMLIEETKGGNLWQELEALSKSEKK